ncbi:uncharacterized protein LOC127848940 isoform X2 [Dreissena polymorpha]|uniref:uncharacterized protein LOC127848940 isoform X2 n=1 Tax=Dreissena polymorpha TaxID=45954 RepID=UPI0022656B61|nr:uncharacterized protein LOC127848940 isoform X2 [Dreissena polymorpha]
MKDSFDQHPSPCVSQQSLQYGDPNNCQQFQSYQEWDLLHDLEIRSRACRKNITSVLAMHFHDPLPLDPCSCHAGKTISNDQPVLEEGRFQDCTNAKESSYSNLRKELFYGAKAACCSTLFHLWQQLLEIRPLGAYDCTMDLILRAANKYPSAELDPCKCTGTLPITSTSTTTRTSSRTTNTTPSSTTTYTTTTNSAAPFSPNRFQCRKYDLIVDIATAKYVHSNDSTPCESKISGTNEDLVLTLCNITAVETWSRGLQVISNCANIASYSPIATFSATGSYQPADAQSGVFLECIPEGFKMAIQPCNGVPQIIHVETTGVFNNNANIYYMVV